jgi:predicted nucleotidyltransferase
MENVKDIIFCTPLLRVLDLLLQHAGQELSDTEITQKIKGAKKSAVHNSLVSLARIGAVKRHTRGRRCYNTADMSRQWLVHLKIAGSILMLAPLIEQLERNSLKVVLFGSQADGNGRHDSDFDLLVVSNEPMEALRMAAGSELSGSIQLIAKTPSEMLDLESREPVFASSIKRGITLWER